MFHVAELVDEQILVCVAKPGQVAHEQEILWNIFDIQEKPAEYHKRNLFDKIHKMEY
jgi:hypothetical protein